VNLRLSFIAHLTLLLCGLLRVKHCARLWVYGDEVCADGDSPPSFCAEG
jgi:hypothetical protein